MEEKITLTLDARLVRAAETLATARGTSLSQLVGDSLRSLLDAPPADAGEGPSGWEDELPPAVRSLLGAFAGPVIDEADYYRYLEEKHR